MKTLYLTNSSANITVDTDTNKVSKLDCADRYDIQNLFLVEEPIHIVYECGETHVEKDAKKGDIVVCFYSNEYFKDPVSIIKSKEWAKGIKNRREAEQKAKEEWAKKNAGNEEPCCDCCCCADLTPATEPVKKEPATKKVKKSKK
jgi:hypothetical protein